MCLNTTRDFRQNRRASGYRGAREMKSQHLLEISTLAALVFGLLAFVSDSKSRWPYISNRSIGFRISLAIAKGVLFGAGWYLIRTIFSN